MIDDIAEMIPSLKDTVARKTRPTHSGEATGSLQHLSCRFPGAMELAEKFAGIDGRTKVARQAGKLKRYVLRRWGKHLRRDLCERDNTLGAKYDRTPLSLRLCLVVGFCVCGDKALLRRCTKLIAAVKFEFSKARETRSHLPNGDVALAFVGRRSWEPGGELEAKSFRIFHVSDVCFSPYGLDLIEMRVLDPKNVLGALGLDILPDDDFRLLGESEETFMAVCIDRAFSHWDLAASLDSSMQ